MGSTPNAIELIAWIGPAIGPSAFEVGDEVRQAFVDRDAGAADAFRPGPRAGKWWADLPALARRRLAAAGVTAVYGNDGSAGWCTAANPSRFFSHRRDAARLGSSGRMAVCVWKA
ncbi:laccase domain-containing protein [uncultured Xylophilus sp.]|uniref:laccase domain-containing protein n=1 Tax=uncultured Xylophilus sp. TaxID=296832 RepID=UPI003451C14C